MAGFSLGDVVTVPVWARGRVEGKICALDIKKGRVRWRGLAVVLEDGTCFEFRAELARPVSASKK